MLTLWFIPLIVTGADVTSVDTAALVTGAKVIASAALDLITKPKVLEEIKNEFAIYTKEHPYKSFLPAGAKPPLSMNKDIMDKYGAQMVEMTR